MSILSKEPDGHGYYYGFAPGDYRQINVRLEHRGANGRKWIAYVGGEELGDLYHDKDGAEAAALAWIKENPG